MSTLTAKLLRVRRRKSVWTERLRTVADRLRVEYGVPSLGNFRNPVTEVFYILLSARTTDGQYRRTHRALTAAFPKLSDLATAKLPAIRRCIVAGGLGDKRAIHSRAAARALLALGKNPARHLRELPVEEAFAVLVALPGVGPKSALCVIMYSLDADAFPVDVNVQRIAARLGAIPHGQTHPQAQRALAAIAPDGVSKALHIGLVVHGRKVCLPLRPKCDRCVLLDLCRYGATKGIADGK